MTYSLLRIRKNRYVKSQIPLFFALFLGFATLAAQQKELNLEEAVLGRYGALAPDRLEQLQWLPKGAAYSYVKDDQLIKADNKGKERVLFNLNALNVLLHDSLKRLPQLSWVDDETLAFIHSGKRFEMASGAMQITDEIPLPQGGKNPVFCQANATYAFTEANNLYVTDKYGTRAVTHDPDRDRVYGQSVSRNEFGISAGIFWSPKGRYLAFYRKDESQVSDYPLTDYMSRVAETRLIKYPMAGMSSERLRIGVYHMKTGETHYLQTRGGREDYLTNISWSPDDRYIFVQELNRAQNHMWLNQFNAATGAFVKTLFEEKSDTYVEPQHPLRFSKIHPDICYFSSNRDGYYHVYKYNTDGKLLRQLTRGDWSVTHIVGFDEREDFLFVEATEESPLERQVYKVNTTTGEMRKLTRQSGTHHAELSEDGSYFIDHYQSTEVPNVVNLFTADGKLVRNLLTATDKAADRVFGENKLVEIPASDGETTLYGRIILPPNFDPKKKYPVIVYVYGGPHSQLVRKTWKNGARWWQYYMAQKGYIAFTLDNRGTQNRGRAFEAVIHRRLGMVETADQMAGIDYLRSLPYVDAERIGVHGWSYGGFMTLNLMLRHPEVFKVGVAGGPVVDWKMYEVMYGERYMDTPQENPQGYKNSNMLEWAPHLKGHLLIIHDLQDATVVIQHSMQFLRKAIEAGKQVDFFTYPTHPHNVRGGDRVHLMEKVSRYFEENL